MKERADNAHKIARYLVSRYSLAFEDLKIVNRCRIITGRKALHEGVPRESLCRALVHKELRDRTHHCPHCGYVQDRDINAAENILAGAVYRKTIRLDGAVRDAWEKKPGRRTETPPA